MKKIVLALAAFGLVTMTSCKKEWTCKCTTTVGGVSTSVEGKTDKTTRKKAKEACEKGSGSALGITTTCEIK